MQEVDPRAMFDLTEPRPVHFVGSSVSAPLQIAMAGDIGVIGTLFKGEIRQLHFEPSGSLLVLAGRGVRRLDPRTLAETGRWLADREVLAVHPCGDRLWVVTAAAIFLAAFGEELGAPFAELQQLQQLQQRTIAAGTRLAVPHDRGVTVLDAAVGTSREFLIDPAWYAALHSSRPPDRALLSPSGRRVGVTVRQGGYTVVWDVDTGARLLQAEHRQASALLDDDRCLHVERNSGMLYGIVDASWSRLPPDAHFEDVAQLRDGRLLVADTWGGFSLYDVAGMTRVAGLDALREHHGRHSSSVCAALSATHVATYAVTAGALRITEIGGATVESFDWIGGGSVLSLGQGGRRVGVFREWHNGRLDCIDLDTDRLVELSGHHVDITDSAITVDGLKVVVPCGSILRARTVHVGDFGSAEEAALHPVKSCVRELVPHCDDAYAVATYTLRGSGHVSLHQASVTRTIAKLTHGKESPWRIAVGHDSQEIVVAWESATILYDMRGRPKPSETWNVGASAVALGPRGFLAFHTADELRLRTPGAPMRVLTLPPRKGHGSSGLAFSRDGALLFVGASDGVLEVRRSDDGTLLRELPLHFGGHVAVRCCGEAMWTMGDDGLVHVVGLAAGPG